MCTHSDIYCAPNNSYLQSLKDNQAFPCASVGEVDQVLHLTLKWFCSCQRREMSSSDR